MVTYHGCNRESIGVLGAKVMRLEKPMFPTREKGVIMTQNKYATLVYEFASGAKFDYDLHAIIYRNQIERNPFYRVKLIPNAVKHGVKCAKYWANLTKAFRKELAFFGR